MQYEVFSHSGEINKLYIIRFELNLGEHFVVSALLSESLGSFPFACLRHMEKVASETVSPSFLCVSSGTAGLGELT